MQRIRCVKGPGRVSARCSIRSHRHRGPRLTHTAPASSPDSATRAQLEAKAVIHHGEAAGGERRPPAVDRYCRARPWNTPPPAPVRNAAARCIGSARTSPKCWTTCRRCSASSATCVRSCRAGVATISRRLQPLPRHSTRKRARNLGQCRPVCPFTAVWPRPLCWRMCWWRNMPIIARYIARPRSMRAAASNWIVPPLRIGWGKRRVRCTRWSTPSARM